MASQVRQNFHEDCEDFINKQINLELYSSYVYLSMAYYFDRDDVALPGMYKFFKDYSDEEREHADALMKLQNKRGGRVVLQDITAPSPTGDWKSTLNALKSALELEKKVNQSLLDLHKIASNKTDPHLTDYLESKFLDEQVESIKKIGCMITQVKRAGPEGLGEYIFDKHQQS